VDALRVALGSLCLGIGGAFLYLAASLLLERPLAELRHWWAHRCGSNEGDVVTWTARDGRLMVGFFCLGCARVCGAHEMPDYVTRPEPKREAR
jgi:hypothetical protein